MSLFTKVFLWKKNKPVTDLSEVEIIIVDKETGEIRTKGCDIGVVTKSELEVINVCHDLNKIKENENDSVQPAN